MTDVIRTHRLTKYYGQKCVVDTLNLSVERGQVYGFLGRNGAGKSTTIKMLMGMVQPDCGTIEMLGENVATMNPATRAKIAYIAEGHPLYNWMTIDEAVKFTRANAGIRRSWSRFSITLNSRGGKSCGGFLMANELKCRWHSPSRRNRSS